MRVLGAKQFFKTTANAAPLKPGASALMSETMSKRLLPGQGETAVTQLLQSLEAAGATPTVGIEVFSLLVNKMPADIVAMQAMDGYRQVASRT
jgi:hypothetical protein